MLEQPVLSLITRMIPEAFLIIYAISRLTNSEVDFKKTLLSGVIGGIGVFISRFLPIHFGVHTIISIMLYITLAVKINEIDIYKAIATAIFSVIMIFISDLILIFIYTNVFKFPTEILVGRDSIAIIAGIPSLVLFYLIIRLIEFFKHKRNLNEQH